MSKRVVTEYSLSSPKLTREHTFAVVSDLHNLPFDPLPAACARAEALLILGDLVHQYPHHSEGGLDFLRRMSARLPTYYTYGNHVDLCDKVYEAEVRKTAAILLNNATCQVGELVLGGLHLYDKPRPYSTHDRRDIGDGNRAAGRHMLEALAQVEGFRLLLSHKPEHFVRYIRPYAIDLTLSGHAHGGQIRVLGRGLYSPGQGILPRWTHGFYEQNRLLVTAGATNRKVVPRWGNPCEIVLLHLLPQGSKI